MLLSAVEIGVFTELANGPEEFSKLAGGWACIPDRRAISSMRWWRWDFCTDRRGLFQHAGDGSVSRPAQAELYRRHPGDGECASLRILESSDGSAAHGPAAERVQGRKRRVAFHGPVRRPSAAEGISCRHVRDQPRSEQAIARKVPWEKYKTYADVGTAQGDLAVQIALANPHLQGIGFDLAEVGPVFDEYAEANGVSGRVRFQAGDFFTEELPNVDVITMGHILHDWSLDEKKMLIGKAWKALSPRGRAGGLRRDHRR